MASPVVKQKMSVAIAIMLKTPGLSSVKTRLAKKIGKHKAEQFHLASATAVTGVVKQLRQQNNVFAYYAVAEQDALNSPYWQDLPCLWQGEGGLGQRMATVYQTLLEKHEAVILLGADIPQMSVMDLENAVNSVSRSGSSDYAMAPSVDGGFWLFAGNRTVPDAVWNDVSYSRADTAEKFYKKIIGLGSIEILNRLRDVDEYEDLLALQQCLNTLSDSVTAQQDLALRLDQILN